MHPPFEEKGREKVFKKKKGGQKENHKKMKQKREGKMGVPCSVGVASAL